MRSICEVIIAFLYVLTSSEASLRGLYAGNSDKRQMHYLFDLVFEDEIADGENEEGPLSPNDETIVCIEKSMASHMDNLADLYIAELEGEKRPPTEPKQWEVQKISYEPDFEKIVLIVQDTVTATIKVVKEGEPKRVETIDLQSPSEFPQRLRKMQGVGGGGPGNSGRGKCRVKRFGNGSRRGRKMKMCRSQITFRTVCDPDHCSPDNMDQGRRRLPAGDSGGNSISFETWMNRRVQDEIRHDCTGVDITTTAFSALEKGEVVRMSEPEHATTSGNEPLSEEEKLLITTYEEVDPGYNFYSTNVPPRHPPNTDLIAEPEPDMDAKKPKPKSESKSESEEEPPEPKSEKRDGPGEDGKGSQKNESKSDTEDEPPEPKSEKRDGPGDDSKGSQKNESKSDPEEDPPKPKSDKDGPGHDRKGSQKNESKSETEEEPPKPKSDKDDPEENSKGPQEKRPEQKGAWYDDSDEEENKKSKQKCIDVTGECTDNEKGCCSGLRCLGNEDFRVCYETD